MAAVEASRHGRAELALAIRAKPRRGPTSDVSQAAIASAPWLLSFRAPDQRLDYYLSRELSKHIGAGERFRDDAARSQFDDALDRHCREASRIVEAFAGGWYGKNVYQGDGLTPDAIRRFAPVVFKKIRAELRKRRDAA